MIKRKPPASAMETQKREPHLLEVNTREGILSLDGIPLMDCVTSCEIRCFGDRPAEVTLGMLIDVNLEERAEVSLIGKPVRREK